jgi:tripartite-type tricarboxylate transporter receptor subunit TctC
MIMRRRHLLAAPLGLAAPALAQEPFPNHPLTLVVPFTAGSATDIAGRIVAQAMGEQLGHAVAVENRAGAGGSVGTGAVARSRPDGYTMILMVTSTVAVNRALYRNLPFDPWRDFAPVGIQCFAQNALMVPAASPFRSLAELVAHGKDASKPQLRYFSPGSGSSQHLSGVLLVQATGIRADHVPYRGPPEGITALVSNEIEFGFSTTPPILGLWREGRLRSLGVSGPQADAAMPEVPTLASLGLGDFTEMDPFYGVAAPKETPPEALARLRAAFAAAMAQPTVRARITQTGFRNAAPMDGPAMDRFLERQVAIWAPLVRASGATVD